LVEVKSELVGLPEDAKQQRLKEEEQRRLIEEERERKENEFRYYFQ
jgi:hypothetical protein